MAKSFSINANIKTTFEGAAAGLTNISKALTGMNVGVKGVTEQMSQEFIGLGVELERLKNRAQTGVLTGAFGDPEATKLYLDDLRKQEQVYNRLTQQTVFANIKNKDTKKIIEGQTAAINAKQAALEKNELALDAIRKKTKGIAEEEARVGNKLNIDPAKLRDPDQIQAEINKRKTTSGQPINKKAGEEIRDLEKLIAKRKEFEKESAGLLVREQQIKDELDVQNVELDQQKQARRDTMLAAVNELKVGKDITKEEKDKLVALIKQGATYEEIEKSVRGLNYKQQTKEIQDTTTANKKFTKSIDNKKKSLFENITAATVYYAALRAIRRIVANVTKTVTQLDKSFTEIAMVTKMTRQESWSLVSSYQNLAKEVGTTTDEIARLGVYFARQGRSAGEAYELTKVAALAAKVASIDASKSADFLTSAINGFGLAAEDAMAISDKFAALGANSASSYEEMAIALSKVAPVAKTAGVGIDTMMAFLAKGIETTREAPENIGTAFKTIFARMTQLRDFGKTLEEGVGVNTVEDALATAGIALRDSQGVFRNMDEVLTELGYKFDSLSRNQQSYIATALAGTRQQSRLLAVMQNFDRTMDLVNISTESAGATLAQHAKYAGGMEAANARLTTSFQQVITGLVNSEVVIGIVNAISNAVASLSFLASNLAPIVLILGSAFALYIAEAKTATIVTLAQTIAEKAATVQTFIHAKSTLFLAKAKDIAALASLNLAGKITLAFGVVGILVGVIYLLVKAFMNMKTSIERSTEKIQDLQVELYNINKETKDLTALVDQFEELDKKVFKTAEDMKEMESILSKIDEHGGNEHDFIFAGQLDMEAIDAYMEAKKLEKKTATEALRTEGSINLQRMLAGEEQTTETKASIAEFLASTIEGFDDLDEAAQNRIRFAVSRDLEGYASAFERSRVTNTGVGMMATRTVEKYYQGTIEPLAEEMLTSFNDLFTGAATDQDAVDLFDKYLLLNPSDKKLIEDAYSQQLGDILKLGDETIKNFLERGYNLSQISRMVGSVQDALSGLNATKMVAADTRRGVTKQAVTGGDIAGSFAQRMSNIDPELPSLSERERVINETITELRRLTYETGSAQEAISGLINAVTDPMAFQNAINIFKSTASTVTSLIDASEAYQKGEIDDKLLALINEYPELAKDLRDGTLDMADSIQIMVAKNVAEVKSKISDLNFQLGVETNAEIAAGIQAQIDTLNDMLTKESFLYGGIAEQVKVRETEKVSDRFKTQIDFIKKYNDEQQKEIDLMQKKLDMNKSMLQLDRQIAALATDTSYGAQARSRDLQDQQRSAAVEREKLVMDLVTEQAISELEKQRDKHISDIAANVQAIVDGMKSGTLGSNPFGQTIGLDYTGR